MQFKAIITLAYLGACASAASISERATACFPKTNVSASVLNLQNYINIVINDIVQNNTTNVANDYSSTGRDLDYFVRALRPKGCATNTIPPSPTTSNGAIANLQQTQLDLSYVSQDNINSMCKKAKKDVCTAFHEYQSVAQYVGSIRTDGSS